MKFELEAPAKVNLCLAVDYPPHADGYHTLKSVFQELDLCDKLTFELRGGVACADAITTLGTHVALDCGELDLPAADNLIFKALDLVEQACGRPAVNAGETLAISVEKHIPAGGGLGGGSSDAAATLKAYAKLTGVDVLDERCLGVARRLGADVAFFLYGGAALMDGRGDCLVRRLPGFRLPLVLMGESEGISTAKIYRDFDDDRPAAGDAEALATAMDDAGAASQLLADLCTNNLEPAACRALPRLGERVAAARANAHTLNALVTGSGATSYAICADEEAARAFEREIAPSCAWTHIVVSQNAPQVP